MSEKNSNSYHVFFSADENYIKYVAPLICSIINSLDLSRDLGDFSGSSENARCEGGGGLRKKEELLRGFVFHILVNTELRSETRIRMEKTCEVLSLRYPCRVVFHVVQDDFFFKNDIPLWKGNYQTYFRFFVGELVDKSVDKCLYLDVDMLVVGDVRELWEVELGQKTLMVAKLPKVFGAKYFNAGFIFFNLLRWREKGYREECLSYTKEHRTNDQVTLNNVVEKDEVLFISEGWDYCLQTPQSDGETLLEKGRDGVLENDVKIIHYIRPKPWACALDWFRRSKGKCFRYQNVMDLWWFNAVSTPVYSDDLLSEKIKINNEFSNRVFSHFGSLFFCKLFLKEKIRNRRLR